MNSCVSIIRCNSYEPALVFEATKKAIDLIGGISNFIKPKSNVLVKPNLLIAKEPQYGITTHPEVVRAVIKILKEINCKIFIGDGPSVWGNQIENIEEVYAVCGMKKICQEESIELVKFDKRRWRGKFPLTTFLDTCDYLVSVPKFKTHSLMTLTGAIKNLFGLVSGTYKTELHKKYFDNEDFARVLVDVYEETRPDLTIIDGITAIEGEGPGTSGRLRQQNLLLAGKDCISLDSILALIMGLKPFDILTVKEGALRELGQADINNITVRGEKLKDVIGKPFLLPSQATLQKRIPRPIINIAKNMIKFYPRIEHDNCTRCIACVKACPQKIMSLENNHIVIDYSKCISCFCCQEACLSSAIRVKKSLFAKIIGL